jgi:hypothetical protein
LPPDLARELVTSMWAPRGPAGLNAKDEPAPAVKKTMDTFLAGVKRDHTLIRECLKKLGKPPEMRPSASLDDLAKEAQAHCWVQFEKQGKWLDLDPSFADSTPGQASGRVEQTFVKLPEKLFQQVEIRVKVEECSVLLTGNALSEPKSRTLLTYKSHAADLSGLDLILCHQPENWNGPVQELENALATPITDTGRIRPVLVIGNKQWQKGEPFRLKPPTEKGIGAVGALLSGQGTRQALALAVAESIEFDFLQADGRKETVVRELFDVVGQARRSAAKNLNAEEVRSATTKGTDMTEAVYDLFFTTGRIDGAHVANAVKSPARAKDGPAEITALMRRVNLAFALSSDAIVPRLNKPGETAVLFYADSPRLFITELAFRAKSARMMLDLRRDHVRAVAPGLEPVRLFNARVFRGVIDGTLELILIERLTKALRDEGKCGPLISTSSIYEQALAEGVSSLLLPSETARLDQKIPENTLARLRQETSSGFVVVVPQRALAIAAAPRLAWWRVDPLSGETIAVGDDGLHPTATDFTITQSASRGKIQVAVRFVLAGGAVMVSTYQEELEDLSNVIAYWLKRGAVFSDGPLGSSVGSNPFPWW